MSNKYICPYCGEELPRNSKFCPNCEYARFKDKNKKRRKNDYKYRRDEKKRGGFD